MFSALCMHAATRTLKMTHMRVFVCQDSLAITVNQVKKKYYVYRPYS